MLISHNIDDKSWDDFVISVPYAGLLQSSLWGRFREPNGWKIKRIGVVAGDGVVAGAQLLIKELAPGLTMAYAPQGPASKWNNHEVDEMLFGELIRVARAEGSFMLRVDPPVSADLDSRTTEIAGELLARHRFRKSFEEIQAGTTIYLDLEKSETELMAAMHQKCRYNIRLAAKKEVVVRVINPEEGVNDFWRLYQTTVTRDNFSGRGENYFINLARLLDRSGNGVIVEARLGEKLLSSLFITLFGNRATYLYGASSNEHREYMPNHLAQWEAIKYARAHGFKYYDFWGVAKDDDAKSPWAGFSRFKRQFGGMQVKYIGAYDRVLSPPKYAFYKTAQRLRKKMLGIASE